MVERRLITLAAVFLVAFPSCYMDTGPETEEQDSVQSEIIGGSPEYGFNAVGVIAYDENDNRIIEESEQHCTGTLIDRRKVLTAAHCIYYDINNPIDPLKLYFCTGSSMNSLVNIYNVRNIKWHPAYNPREHHDDIGLIYLYPMANEMPMRVARRQSYHVGDKLYFIGYGRTSASGGNGTKRGVWTPITEIGKEKIKYGNASRNTCYGDSGGPALYGFEVAGVIVETKVGCSSDSWATRVDKYLKFIGDHCGDGKCNGDEDTVSCGRDCIICRDGICSQGETTCSCPEDCGRRCGDGCCNSGETCSSCSDDCGSCGGGGGGGCDCYPPPCPC